MQEGTLFLRSVELVVSTIDIDIFNKTYKDTYNSAWDVINRGYILATNLYSNKTSYKSIKIKNNTSIRTNNSKIK